MFFNAEENKLNLTGLQMDYIAFGKGGKPLVMIQGLNTRGIKGTSKLLAYTYRIFAKDYRVYLFDRRAGIYDGITVRDFAADTAMAMDALNIKKADVFGVSQGGMIGQYLAIDRPDLVNKLALAVTLSKNNDTVTNVINHWIDAAKRGDMKHLVSDMAEKMYSKKYLKRYRILMPLLTVLQKPEDANRFIALAKSCLTCNTYYMLNNVRCPVFVIGGGQDKVAGIGSSEEIADKLGCKRYIYKELGHAAYQEAKDFNKRVYNFFKE
ncbi:MAG: alpha/beta hydrolase [Ruminococcaceae bacterium]|nr:alpha/beta hydrolase [Oscillospiraceae bacterium]